MFAMVWAASITPQHGRLISQWIPKHIHGRQDGICAPTCSAIWRVLPQVESGCRPGKTYGFKTGGRRRPRLRIGIGSRSQNLVRAAGLGRRFV